MSSPRQVIFRPEAENEVLDVRQWYESRRQGLGREFGEALDARIVANPLTLPVIYSEIHRAVLPRFPYAVYFRLAENTVVVLAVHGRQHPSAWQRRSRQDSGYSSPATVSSRQTAPSLRRMQRRRSAVSGDVGGWALAYDSDGGP